MNEISVEDMKLLIDQSTDLNLIDVREVSEYNEGHIKKAKNIPLSEINNRLSEFNPHLHYHIICRSGKRSEMACHLLEEHNIHTTNVEGGMVAWSQLK